MVTTDNVDASNRLASCNDVLHPWLMAMWSVSFLPLGKVHPVRHHEKLDNIALFCHLTVDFTPVRTCIVFHKLPHFGSTMVARTGGWVRGRRVSVIKTNSETGSSPH
ncbi:hypothetical protein PoB_004327700 [Plakobranchus ocellatus]|uniref:Uncharacterized protein n=1 Tax=Plakobranchus ocellatus TaxID=259542 RepID=A0AAV4BCU1_9GAST|nr:hypothetical protein PoB_004327700 [Plakobranchus ocellatus]